MTEIQRVYEAKGVFRALSVRQPWASLIACGAKTIETRKWWTKYRGPLLICSSLKVDEMAMEWIPSLSVVRGKAMAIVDLVNCRPMERGDEDKALCPLYERAFSWVLDNVRFIDPPIPVRGKLGLFEVEL